MSQRMVIARGKLLAWSTFSANGICGAHWDSSCWWVTSGRQGATFRCATCTAHPRVSRKGHAQRRRSVCGDYKSAMLQSASGGREFRALRRRSKRFRLTVACLFASEKQSVVMLRPSSVGGLARVRVRCGEVRKGIRMGFERQERRTASHKRPQNAPT